MKYFPNIKEYYKEQRRTLLESLSKRGIHDRRILAAMNEIPREIFVSPAQKGRAYEDSALPIDCSQSISQPYTVAIMTQLLEIQPDDKILEVGTGSGYQAILLSIMGARVFSIERIKNLHDSAREVFKKYNFKINSMLGDGTLGWREFSPYNGIIVTAAAPKIPQLLVNQLAIGGRLVVPIGSKTSQEMYLITRKNEKETVETHSDFFKFVPLIGKDGWKQDDY